ncbi:MAG: flagellar hook-basal body complex protein [Planctomycetes bacterium]|nr:flagellar hook-basal body complex protein [Planctomycetota bacterium]
MGNALLSGVAGLKAHQTMLDVTGNNLANLNTTAFKASRVTFGELLSQTIREASQPTAGMGGTNPMQVGSGVMVASVDRDMTQGSPINTGQPLDMAIDGAGYFVLSDGQRNVYTRVGAFGVDADYYLVDPGTGFRVQRIGNEGVTEGFQGETDTSIRIPYDIALPAKVTSEMWFTGNLSSDATNQTRNVLSAGIEYALPSGAVASENNLLTEIAGANVAAGDKIVITGTKADGAYIGGAAAGVTYTIEAGDKIGDLLAEINAACPGSTASLVNGAIRITDDVTGYSQTAVTLTYTPAAANPTGAFPLPSHFNVLSAGGEENKTINVEVFDSQGVGHVITGSFVRRPEGNLWDFVLTSITGDVELVDRRVNGIKFLPDGSFGGLTAVTGPDGLPMTDQSQIRVTYANDPTNIVSVSLNLGTIGSFDGLSQFGGSSTVAPSGQNGYASGWLSSLSVSRDGVLVGVFSNGVRRDIAAIQMATFQNAAGLQSVGNNAFTASTNSGDPIPTKALSGGAGSITGGALEKSNVEVASEFVNLMQAQNGFQANARTIRVANEMLRELTNLIS